MDDFFATVIDRWPAGREDLHWHLLPDPEQARAGLFEPYQELTHRDNVVPVAPPWYHVTSLHSVPAASLSAGQLDRIIEEVRRRCETIGPFELTLDRPTIGQVAVECAGRPGAATRALWRAAADSTTTVLGNDIPVIPEVYYPHMSLAYAVGHTDHRQMKAWLSDHDIPPFVMPVTAISLVAQSHDRRTITWRHLLDIPLLG